MLVKYQKIFLFAAFILSLGFSSDIVSQQSWTLLTRLNGTVTGFAVNNNHELFASTLGGGVYRTTDNGSTWVPLNSGIQDYLLNSIHITASGVMYVGCYNLGVFKSTNNGINWIQTSLNVNIRIRALTSDIYGNVYAGSQGHGIFRTTDEGQNWSNTSYPDMILSMASSENGYVFAGSNNPDAIYRSVDSGKTFQQAAIGDQAFNTIVVRAEHIYSVTGNFETDYTVNYKIIYSSNYGDSWITTSTFSNSSLGLTLNQNNDLFLGKYRSIYKSTDGGHNFAIISSGINQLAGRVITIGCDSAGFIYLGAELGDIYKSSETTIGITSQNNNIPLSFKLNQNYPNPFNPSTIINYQLSINSNVKLSVFDALGKEVQLLVNQKQKTGSYSVLWDASAYASGIYFCKLEVEGYSETMPMVLVK